jgi:4-hydroxy-3-polyprenylbenzoate decarboxylase
VKRVIVGISGASGAIYGIRLLEVLREADDVEIHLVLTPAARRTVALETDLSVHSVEALADYCYRPGDIAAAISSGSFRTEGMVVAPCSMKTVSGIATSYSDDLLLRAADVTLKEWRRLVLLVRETPLHLGHLRLLVQVAELGAMVVPPVPAFYHRPATLEAMVDQTVNRTCDLLGIELNKDLFPRWQARLPRYMTGTDPPARTISRLTQPKETSPMATITHAIRIRAPRAQVYQALTTPYGLKGWNTPDLEGDVAQGQEFTLCFNDGQSFQWKASELINGSTVSWECISGPGAAVGSTVTYELSDTSDGRTAV